MQIVLGDIRLLISDGVTYTIPCKKRTRAAGSKAHVPDESARFRAVLVGRGRFRGIDRRDPQNLRSGAKATSR